jgi:hypothetical protein
MPTWNEIQDYVRSKYKLARDEKEWFSLVWKYADDRTQLIIVRHFTAFNQSWLEFKSAFCKVGEMPAEEALRRNGGFAVGAIAIDGDHVIFRHTVPLKDCQTEEFELPLHVVAQTADQFEREVTKGGDKF